MVEIEFDPAKDSINRKKHGIGLAAAVVILRGRQIRQRSALPNERDEERWVAVGRIEGRFFVCVYTMRVGVFRVISLRAARTKERRAYEEAFRSE